MKDFLHELGIEPETKEERKEIDLAIREAVEKKRDDKCNEVWKEVKIWLSDDKKRMLLQSKLKE